MNLNRCFLPILCASLGIASTLTPLIARAAEGTQIGKTLTPQGGLQNVVVMTDGLMFYVNETGQIGKVTPNPNQPAPTSTQTPSSSPTTQTKAATAPSGPQPLKTKYRPYSAMTGARQLIQVNDVKISYYSTMGQRPMGASSAASSPYGNRTPGSTNYNASSLAQSVQNQSFSANANSDNSSQNQRKVRKIGDVEFTYYSSNDLSGNGGKINRVGDYRITYYNRSDLSGRAGKVRSFKK